MESSSGIVGNPYTPVPPTVITHSLNPPQLLEHVPHVITICHPAWPDNHDIFLQLYALDDLAKGAAHFGSIWLAAAIIAGNAFDGFLSRSKDPTSIPLPHSPDNLLEHGKYWFHVPAPQDDNITPYLYPICHQFAEWQYPHGRVPNWWPHSDVVQPTQIDSRSVASQHVHGMDGVCRISGYSTGTQAAHICPVSEDVWFRDNEMYRYIANGIDNLANLMLLRADLRLAFDAKHFAFVPKQGHFVVHFLNILPDIIPLYNNQLLLPTGRVSGHCLLVRFAWSIFRCLQLPGTEFPERYLGTKQTTVENVNPPSAGKKKRRPKEPGNQPSRPKLPRKAKDHQPTDRWMSPSLSSSNMPENQEEEEEEEEREDWRLFEQDYPGIHEVDDPCELSPTVAPDYESLVIYPGYRRINRMKEQALRAQRPDTSSPTSNPDNIETLSISECHKTEPDFCP